MAAISPEDRFSNDNCICDFQRSYHDLEQRNMFTFPAVVFKSMVEGQDQQNEKAA